MLVRGEKSLWFRMLMPRFLKEPKASPGLEKYPLLVLAGMFAVLGGLVALIDPPSLSLTGFMQKAHLAHCEANLYQLSTAFELYARRYQGRLPADAARPTLAGSLKLLRWTDDAPAALYCRGDQRPQTGPAASYEQLTVTNISYTYVPFVSWAAGTGFGDSNKIVLIDRIYTGKQGDYWPATGNHGDRGGHVLHADGRVEFYQAIPSDLTDDRGRPGFLSP